MKESIVQQHIMLALSQEGVIVWRNETAGAWVGRQIHTSHGQVTLADSRMIQAGLCKGSSDLVCIKPTVITQDMVGKTVGVFTAIEVKTEKGRATSDQNKFIEGVKAAGGIAGIARSVNDALELIK